MKMRLHLTCLVFLGSLAGAGAQQKSVKPGINDSFRDPGLQVVDWLKRFEIESREVYAARDAVLEACQLKPGMVIADIGAGTGLYTHRFIDATGPNGWVYAVDISPRFLEHIHQRARSNQTRNVTSVLCADDHVGLPPNTIDLAFICDTYHHFEFPQATMQSIAQALKPGGQLIVIDFKRIQGVSREWTMSHVRAGQEVFRQEITEAGLVYREDVPITGLHENYCMRFVKPR
ncbi:MAG: ubiquinone/menaquinone biosynthesis C-methylase UbiE [Kiritimatiellia bacterium]|jgi:ubiquinone/menaquinone biosynthesis C-methylase UbiE